MDYERGLDRLKQYAEGTSWLHEFVIYESQLRENLHSERLYGSDEQVRRNRNRIVGELNRLAQKQLGISFNDLCLTVSPSIPVDHVQKTGTSASPLPQGVFVCYCHRDERYLNELRTHLAHYVRTGMINYWDDTKILPGTKWREETQRALQGAQVAVLLISADFFASDSIIQDELPLLLDAAEHKKITIFCVIVRPCLFIKTELAQFQAINDPSLPLSTMSYGKREEIWVKVAEYVRDKLQADG